MPQFGAPFIRSRIADEWESTKANPSASTAFPQRCIQLAMEVRELQERQAPPATRHPLSLGSLLLGVVLGFLLLASWSHVAQGGFWNRAVTYLTGRTTRIDVSSPSVVEKIRQLSRLETVVFSLDKIVSGGRENPYLPDFLVGDKLLLVAHGEVMAGVDLSQLQSNNVTVHGDSVQVRLPAPQVLSTRIDNASTRIYSRTTGLLVPPDPNLESQVRQAAEQQITQAALDDHILDKAHQNAQTALTALLTGLGFRHVDVQ